MKTKFQQELEKIIERPLFLRTIDEDRWITVENGEHVLLGEGGEIKGGMGGKFDGKKMGELRGGGNSSKSNPPFGEPGKYHVYRAGSLETQRGIISIKQQ